MISKDLFFCLILTSFLLGFMSASAFSPGSKEDVLKLREDEEECMKSLPRDLTCKYESANFKVIKSH